ncbi:hypothetical protein NPIL_270491 [Nephila pilipes]|uniref:Uncharacterized protein n=1 Tax=Nephila pilipes TaxID=299642 RepID=A0A8X6N4T7_NEPPI|nr:hypothetical protein NPIL_270491 [Nephila pilipes]
MPACAGKCMSASRLWAQCEREVPTIGAAFPGGCEARFRSSWFLFTHLCTQGCLEVQPKTARQTPKANKTLDQ